MTFARKNKMAPYAVHDDETGGRIYKETPHPFRTDFQRDRDRILHSKAFRRLEYKTQVFLSGSGDHLRNRLTHTIEVAAITRTIARSLGLNEDLAEAIALAHDIGHTPFGHAGERAMDKILKDQGGFDHNGQALRTVDVLEVKYPSYNGINLTFAVRSGLLKHRGNGAYLDGKKLPDRCSLEAQAADLADDLTYYGHDVDDGLDSGIITLEMMDELEIWRRAAGTARECGLKHSDERFSAISVRNLIDMMVGDAVRYSSELISQANPQCAEDVIHLDRNLISFSPEFQHLTGELKKFLFEKLYFAPELKKLNDLSLTRMQFLYDKFIDSPELMGETARNRIAVDGLRLAVADYVAGMTDTFAVSEYLRLCPPKRSVQKRA